ncbi:MAG: iron-containing alcohol dehydrogenase, partial [Planctomycetes bacterium]|nr:iron-containing alcohol dehydrogenase [Planctomycetota bacterium]
DAAKVVPVLAANKGPLTRYDIMGGGNMKIKGPLPPMIAIPTTAGTGSEVGRCSVITNAAEGRKFLVCHPEMMPARAILDPELTMGLPAMLTAGTGMDALTHNIEALVVDMFHPMCDAIALKGIELIAGNLEKAVKNPTDIAARGNMMVAAMMGWARWRFKRIWAPPTRWLTRSRPNAMFSMGRQMLYVLCRL